MLKLKVLKEGRNKSVEESNDAARAATPVITTEPLTDRLMTAYNGLANMPLSRGGGRHHVLNNAGWTRVAHH